MKQSRKEKALAAALDILEEYFDTAQILVTKYEGTANDSTNSSSAGFGNIFARVAQTKIWAEEQENNLTFSGEEDDDDNDD